MLRNNYLIGKPTALDLNNVVNNTEAIIMPNISSTFK